ncbi:prepilin peptidase [Micromonospora humi]|uniref:Leader peptidase (Prepilin peptidase) / N-methyltransferase n=1 Tax=Micromonospora humi TaxID=745366 RepID=A0A1C5I918_9ACTN|nr:A24 family peptidase [Micromonospora humi]SCG54962.1 leader peptidase (prepilin peptidase) / N-methyltransferase [Micromonospora humi]
MSTVSVAGAALLGALAGLVAVPLGRRLVGGPRHRASVPSGDALGLSPGGAGAGVGPATFRGGMAVAGAVVFGGLAGTHGADPALPVLLLIATAGLVLAVTDLIALRLPDPLVGAVALGGLGLVGAALVTGEPGRAATALSGAGLSLVGYLLLALLPGARLGFGDVKLAAALGFPLGWLGWPALRLGLLLPHVLAGTLVLVLLAAGRIRRDTPLPFGPAILTGAWLAAVLTWPRW